MTTSKNDTRIYALKGFNVTLSAPAPAARAYRFDGSSAYGSIVAIGRTREHPRAWSYASRKRRNRT